MISDKMTQALNEQVNREMYSAYLYMAMSAHCNQVKLEAIQAPPTRFESPLDMFTQTLAHEQFITSSINDLMEVAIAEKDHASQIFLEWYVSEQVEEEENDNDIIAQLKWIKDNPQGLMMLDRELAGRMTTVPTDFSKGVASAMAAAGA
jgi:ferritin